MCRGSCANKPDRDSQNLKGARSEVFCLQISLPMSSLFETSIRHPFGEQRATAKFSLRPLVCQTTRRVSWPQPAAPQYYRVAPDTKVPRFMLKRKKRLNEKIEGEMVGLRANTLGPGEWEMIVGGEEAN